MFGDTDNNNIGMKVKFKKVRESAFVPTKAHSSDAGFDLYADSKGWDENGNVVYGTGIAVEIPEGYVGLVFPRSSIAGRDLQLSNSVGVIDSGYRGEIMAKFRSTVQMANPLKVWWRVFVKGEDSWDYKNSLVVHSLFEDEYELGERIAQLIIMPYPEVEFEEVEELSNSDRGENGYGSTGM